MGKCLNASLELTSVLNVLYFYYLTLVSLTLPYVVYE